VSFDRKMIAVDRCPINTANDLLGSLHRLESALSRL
jgi:hypothetical protein